MLRESMPNRNTAVLLIVYSFSVVSAAQDGCGNLVNVEDFHEYFRNNTPSKAYRYVEEAAGNGDTCKWNMESLRNIRFRPKLLVDVSKRSLGTTLLREEFSLPFGAGPTPAQKNAHSDGELGTAKACAAAGVPMILSSFSTVSIEDVIEAGKPSLTLWAEVLFFTNRQITLDLVKRAEKAGAKAIVLTVDVPAVGLTYDSMRDNYSLPEGQRYQNFVKYNVTTAEPDPSATWKDIDWIWRNTNLPIVVKGILRTEDALSAVARGAKAIIVSNNGGRQLDGDPATIDVLPDIVAAVATTAEVYFDSGVRTGMDILKALSLGAKAVFLGRPIQYGLSYQGEKGVKCVLDILRNELDNVMMQTGETDAKRISRLKVTTRS